MRCNLCGIDDTRVEMRTDIYPTRDGHGRAISGPFHKSEAACIQALKAQLESALCPMAEVIPGDPHEMPVPCCAKCGRRDGLMTMVPDAAWEKIAGDQWRASWLCIHCIDGLAAERGVRVTARIDFFGRAIAGHVVDEGLTTLPTENVLHNLRLIDALREELEGLKALVEQLRDCLMFEDVEHAGKKIGDWRTTPGCEKCKVLAMTPIEALAIARRHQNSPHDRGPCAP